MKRHNLKILSEGKLTRTMVPGSNVLLVHARILLRMMILEVTPAHGMSDAELEQILPEYDAVVVRSANRITRSMLVASPRVAVVGRAGSGVDNIDLDAALELGVPVVNAPTANAGSVAGQLLYTFCVCHIT